MVGAIGKAMLFIGMAKETRCDLGTPLNYEALKQVCIDLGDCYLTEKESSQNKVCCSFTHSLTGGIETNCKDGLDYDKYVMEGRGCPDDLKREKREVAAVSAGIVATCLGGLCCYCTKRNRNITQSRQQNFQITSTQPVGNDHYITP